MFLKERTKYKIYFDVYAHAAKAEPLPDAQWGATLLPQNYQTQGNKNSSFSSCRVVTFLHCCNTPQKPLVFPILLAISSIFKKTDLSHCLQDMKRILIKKKSLQQLQNTMTGLNEVQCSIAHVLLGSCCGLQGCRCTQLNATGFPLSSLILGFHIHTLSNKAQLSFTLPLPRSLP